MRQLIDCADEVVEAVREGAELTLEPENKDSIERIEAEIVEIQEAALALHKAKQRLEVN